MSYKAILMTDRWKKIRAVVLKRDNYCCTSCGYKKELHVHHSVYIKNESPLDVPIFTLQTLCSHCHALVHLNKDIDFVITKSQFKQRFKKQYRANTIGTKTKTKKKKPKKKVSVKYKMTASEKKLQKRYNEVKKKLSTNQL